MHLDRSNPIDAWQALPLPDAALDWWPHWLAAAEADALFAALHAGIAWENHALTLYGRSVAAPRLSAWIGDPQAVYTYSRRRFEPRPWTPLLAELRDRVARACAARFNSVLVNLYRDGADAMGWHSDDEPELGPAPLIASLSLGAERVFALRARRPCGMPAAAPLRLVLPHGSLLRMAGDTQRRYLHALPRTRRPVGARINLTFRWIESPRP